MIEESQNLDGATLEGLRQLSNIEAEGQKLLQLIFVGPPEFMKKLDDPELGSLKQRVALHARLTPLSRSEVGRYLEFRIQAAGYQGASLFAADAVARIAHYSRGIPRLVNTICDNGLLTAYCNSKTEVSQMLIDEVAEDMGLVQHKKSSFDAAIDSESWNDPKEQGPDSQIETVWSNLQLNSAAAKPGLMAPPARRAVSKMIGAALLLPVCAVAAGGIMHFEKAGSLLDNLKAWTEQAKFNFLNESANVNRETAIQAPPQRTGDADINSAATDGGHADARTEPPAKEQRQHEESTPGPLKSPEAQEAKQFHGPARSVRMERRAQHPAVKRRLMEIEIHRAIQNRAITGVTVRLIDGTAILGGEVASVRQRALAERAALSVIEVAKVDNQIAIQR